MFKVLKGLASLVTHQGKSSQMSAQDVVAAAEKAVMNEQLKREQIRLDQAAAELDSLTPLVLEKQIEAAKETGKLKAKQQVTRKLTEFNGTAVTLTKNVESAIKATAKARQGQAIEEQKIEETQEVLSDSIAILRSTLECEVVELDVPQQAPQQAPQAITQEMVKNSPEYQALLARLEQTQAERDHLQGQVSTLTHDVYILTEERDQLRVENASWQQAYAKLDESSSLASTESAADLAAEVANLSQQLDWKHKSLIGTERLYLEQKKRAELAEAELELARQKLSKPAPQATADLDGLGKVMMGTSFELSEYTYEDLGAYLEVVENESTPTFEEAFSEGTITGHHPFNNTAQSVVVLDEVEVQEPSTTHTKVEVEPEPTKQQASPPSELLSRFTRTKVGADDETNDNDDEVLIEREYHQEDDSQWFNV